MPAAAPPTQTQTDLYAASAGLDLLSGVFGFLSSIESASAANSRADMIRTEAEMNAQRYSEQAAAQIAQTAVMFTASGVTLAGSPIDVLDTKAQLAQQNEQSILMSGEAEALDESQRGLSSENSGRNALLGSISAAGQNLGKAFPTGFGNSFTPGNSAGGVSAAQMAMIGSTA